MSERTRESLPPVDVAFDLDECDAGAVAEARAKLQEAGARVGAQTRLGMDGPVEEHWLFGTEHLDPDWTWIRRVQEENHEWRKENVPGAFELSTAGHVVGEAAELQDHFVKAAEYEGREVDEREAKEEAGDVVVALMSLLSMRGWDVVECVELARQKNDDRDWDEHTGRADA